MNDKDAIQKIAQNLADAVARHRAKHSVNPSDCISECAAAYDRCMATAGSDLEKAVCNSAYTKCISNC